jgi:homoserine kinase
MAQVKHQYGAGQAKRVVVETCASSANIGPGFDVFALALAKPSERLSLSASSSDRFEIKIHDSTGILPTSTERNAAGKVVVGLAHRYKLKAAVKVVLDKRIPIGVGLGSSGASAAAAAFAMNQAFDLGMDNDDLVYHAGEGEFAASGAAHYDNVAASVYGGFVIVGGKKKPDCIMIRPPRSLKLCIATPVVKLPARKTEFARSILPRSVPLSKVTKGVSRASLVVAGFVSGNIDLIGRGLHDDIVESARQQLIPGYSRVKESALSAGASGVCISGAGPSVLALVEAQKSNPAQVLHEMLSTFSGGGTKATGFVTKPGRGARVVEFS